MKRICFRYMAYLCTIFYLLLLAGCATLTSQTKLSEAKQVSSERLLAFQTQSEKTTAKIVAIRDQGLVGSGCYYALYINKILSGRFDVSEFTTFHVEPGNYLVQMARDPMGKGLCSVGHDFDTKMTILKPNEEKCYRLSIGIMGHSSLNVCENLESATPLSGEK